MSEATDPVQEFVYSGKDRENDVRTLGSRTPFEALIAETIVMRAAADIIDDKADLLDMLATSAKVIMAAGRLLQEMAEASSEPQPTLRQFQRIAWLCRHREAEIAAVNLRPFDLAIGWIMVDFQD